MPSVLLEIDVNGRDDTCSLVVPCARPARASALCQIGGFVALGRHLLRRPGIDAARNGEEVTTVCSPRCPH